MAEQSNTSTTANPVTSQEPNSTLDSHGRPAKKRSLIDVGKGSSQPNKDAASGQQRRGSKRSLPGRKRKGSLASSQASRRGQGSAAAAQNTNLPTPVKGPAPDRPKKSGMSKFLAILNCCRAPSPDHAEPVESPEAARKVERPSQSTQSTPPQKSETGLKEKDVVDERKQQADKAAAASTFSKSPVTANEKKLPASARSDESPDVKGASGIPGEVLAPPSEKSNIDKPLPASPKSEDSSTAAHAGAAAAVAGTAGLAAAGVTPASKLPSSKPEKLSVEDTTSSTEEQMISDRTPEQARKDEEIEMKDVPPSVPLASNEVPVPKDITAPTSEATQSSIPPPPPTGPAPTSDIQAQVTTVKSAEPQVGVDQQRQGEQKWLLPPMRPELKGRKCLVLDLDETLVHSSFKVRSQPSTSLGKTTDPLSRSYIKPTSRYPSKLKANITMSTSLNDLV